MGKVAILGSGHGGCTYSAYLGKRGHEVRLWDSERFKANLDPIAANGGLDITVSGDAAKNKAEEEGFGPIAMVTTDIEKAIDGVDAIMVVVPGFGVSPIAKAIAPYLKAGQTVMLNPGQVLGALEFLNTLRENGNDEDITICEGASNMFACRRTGPTTVNFMALKNQMELASIPASRIGACIGVLDEFFPGRFAGKPSILHTSLSYTNLLVHPAGSLLNMGWIEWTKGGYDFYWEGLTPSVCRNIEAVDAERLAIAKAYGAQDMPTFLQISHDYYGHRERTTIHEFISKSDVHGGHGPSAPPDMGHRYITEDIPFALVPLSELGAAMGIATPVVDALITIASFGNAQDYRQSGRNLKRLGLAGLDKADMLKRIENGR